MSKFNSIAVCAFALFAPSSVFAAQIAAVADRGNTGGRHYFELYGDFTGDTRSVAVYCAGTQVPSRLDYESNGQLNVSIAELPSGTSCSFRYSGSPHTITAIQDRGDNGSGRVFELYGSFPGAAASPPTYTLSRVRCGFFDYSAHVEFQSPAQINVFVENLLYGGPCEFPLLGNMQSASYGPRLLQVPELEISAANDRGIVAGERHFELYGRFSATGLSVQSICNGGVYGARITYSSMYQLNIATWANMGGDWSCALTVRGTAGGRQIESAAFHKQGIATHANLPEFFGAYYGGGRISTAGTTPLATQTSALRASGFQAARFLLSPRVRGDLIPNTETSLPYGIDANAFKTACPPGTPFLPCAIRNSIYQQAISQSGLKTIVFSAYDSATTGDAGASTNFLNSAFLTAHASEIVAEYRDLTVALYETQANSGKTFIIANSNSDNHLYCGSVYSYVGAQEFRDTCPTVQVEEKLAALRHWFSLRQQGIRQGRALAAGLNLGGVHVADGIEFNSFHMLDNLGPSVLNDIIPHVRPEWASYSSWETIDILTPGYPIFGPQYGGGPSLPAQMATEVKALKQYLAEQTATTRLMIGEVGFRGSAGDLNDSSNGFQNLQIVQALEVFNAAKIPLVIWSSHNAAPVLDLFTGEHAFAMHEGFYNADGSERGSLRTARGISPPLPPQIRPVISAAVNVAPLPSSSHVELYGQFPGGNDATRKYLTKASCADATGAEVESWVEETYESAGQINIALPRPACGPMGCPPPAQRSCRIVVIDTQDYTASVPFGPVVITWP